MSLPSLEPAPKGPDSEADEGAGDQPWREGHEAVKLTRLMWPTKRLDFAQNIPFW